MQVHNAGNALAPQTRQARSFADRAARLDASLCAGIIATTVVLVAFTGFGGIPGYRHDWQWPPFSAMLIEMFFEKLDPWNWKGFGAPNTSLQVHPALAVTAALATFAPARGVLLAWVGATAFAGGYGMARLAGIRFGADRLGQVVSGTYYALGAVVINETVAGHLPYLLAYSLVPAFLVAVSDQRPRARWSSALLLALIAMQIQVAVYAVFLAVTLVRPRWNAVSFAGAGLIVITLLPFMWGLLRPDALSISRAMVTSAPWEAAQSSPLVAAFAGSGYFTGYYDRSVDTLWAVRLLPSGASLAICIAALAHPRIGLRFLAAAIAGMSILSGFNGPAAPLLSSLFAHVVEFSIFRELYHAAVLVAVPQALALGLLLTKSRLGAVLGILIVAGSIAPWLAGTVLGQTAVVVHTSELSSFVRAVSSERIPSRYMLAPGTNPVGPAGQAWGGADPFAIGVGSAAPMFTYLPRGYEGAALLRLNGGGKAAEAMQRLLGIRRVTLIRGITTKLYDSAAVKPPFRNVELPPSSLTVASLATSLVRIIPRHDSAALPLEPEIAASVHGGDPFTSWAPAADWWFLGTAVADAQQSGLVTFARSETFVAPCNRRQEAAAFSLTRLDATGVTQVRAVHCGRNRITQPAGSVTVVSTKSGERTWRQTLATSHLAGVPIRLEPLATDMLLAHIDGRCVDCDLILAESYSSKWVASRNGVALQSEPARSIFTSWRGTFRPGDMVVIRYREVRKAHAMEAASALAWLVLAACCAWTPQRARKRAYTA